MKVAVLAGGTSTERDVSLISGKMVSKALKENGHKVVMVDVYLGIEGDVSDIFEKDFDFEKMGNGITAIDPDIDKIKALRKDGGKEFFGPNVLNICRMADAVFMALHGQNGEDGKIQATLELLGIPYTGTDAVSSAMCMDKGITKDIFYANNVPTPKGILIKKGENENDKVPYPCIVKATCGGSSVGVSIANNDKEYETAKAEAFKYDPEAVVEQFIKGREFSVGVLKGKALPVIEIAPKEGFYDYKNKYQAGSTIETCPALISEAKTKEMQMLAERAFKALRIKNYARMDFMMDGDENLYCLEANTLPGMTPTSLMPQEAAVIGMDYNALCEELLNCAFN